MRQRLLAFGCSFTFGHGLSDCIADDSLGPGWKPSKFAWPSLLASELDLQCVNLGIPGASNKLIWHNLVNTQYRFGDTVIVLWTYPERNCIITGEAIDDFEEITTYDKTRRSKAFYKHLYKEYDMVTDLNTRMAHSFLYLNSISVKSYHAVYNSDEVEILKWNSTPLLKTSLKDIQHNYPKALDKAHPGPEAHKEYAKLLYNEITEKK